ncbi:MAG TPA: hypothetical protein DCG38_11635 [Eubacteriaceae bacterium]|jgi:ribosomal protein L14E/L6E/L27E|nr:hypothetical protein [Eubacteriaceae bacterium]
MDEENLKLGQVVRSIAGRDKGNFMVVFRTDEPEFASIADGDLRRIEKGKRKKIKHLAKTNYVVEDINKKLTKGLKVTNAEIRRGLDRYKKDCLIGEQEVVK